MCWAPGRQLFSVVCSATALLLYLANPPPDSLRTNTTSLATSPSLAFDGPFVPRLLTSIDGLLLLLAFSYDYAPQQLILVFSVWRAFARLRFSKSLSFPNPHLWRMGTRFSKRFKKTDGRNTQLGGRSVDRNDRAPRRSRSFATYTCDASLVRRAASRRSTRSP